MSDTIPNIVLTDEWQDVFDLTGIEVGNAIAIENIGHFTCELHVSETKPDERPVNVGATSLYSLATKYLGLGNTGCWARNKPATKGTRLQVSEAGGLTTTAPTRILDFPSLFIKFTPFNQLADSSTFALVRNRTNASMILNQLVEFESHSLGNQDGTSLLSYVIYFNIDLTGSTQGVSVGKAYANNLAGVFGDITGTAIDIFDISDFDVGLNPDNLRISGGSVVHFTSAQSTAISITNEQLFLAQPIVIPAAGQFVIAYANTAVIDGGTDTITQSLISGRFLKEPIGLLPPSTADFDSDYTNDFA